ncbi:MAG: 6-bladed beta-propeller [Gemmatimonadota bacterium]|nr:6-bladed beta-propeller [Gemmatimonadota bacterium]
MMRLKPQSPLLPAVALLTATASCDRPQEDVAAPPAVTIRDSAGIEIVESHAPEWDEGDAWAVATEPSVVIGGYRGAGQPPDSSHLVWSVADVAPLSDGRIAVLSGREKKLFLFEPSGEFAGSIGREGRGPGEFAYPQHLQVLPGDTLVVWDFMYGSVAHFTPSGELLKSWRVDVGRLMTSLEKWNRRLPESIQLPSTGGSFFVAAHLAPLGFYPPSPYRSPIEYYRIDSLYVAHPFGRWDEREHIYEPGIPASVPFPPEAHLVVGGSPVSVYITNGDDYEVHQFSDTGTLRRIVRRNADPIPITASDIERWKEGWERRNAEYSWEPWDAVMAELPPREFRPAVVGLLVDSEGYLWVSDRKDATTSEWSVFDATGRWLGTLELPLQRVEWIGEDLILGIREDADTGVEVVEGYRLSR